MGALPGLLRLLEVFEPVLGPGLADRDAEIVVRPGELDPVSHAEQSVRGPLEPFDGDVPDLGTHEGEGVPDVDREAALQSGFVQVLDERERLHALFERIPIRPPLEGDPSEEPMGLRAPDAVSRILEDPLRLETALHGGVEIQVLPSDLAASEQQSSADPGGFRPEPLEGLGESPVRVAEMAESVVEVAQRFGHLGLLLPAVPRQRGQVEEHTLEMVRRDFGFVRGARGFGGPPVVLVGFRRHLPEEVVPAQLSEDRERGLGVHLLEDHRDLAVEHSEAALGERPIDARPELLFREREPLAPGSFRERPEVDEALELLRERFLLDPHRPHKEREIELRPDGARVGEDAQLLRREGLERRVRPTASRAHSGRLLRHRPRASRRSELNSCPEAVSLRGRTDIVPQGLSNAPQVGGAPWPSRSPRRLLPRRPPTAGCRSVGGFPSGDSLRSSSWRWRSTSGGGSPSESGSTTASTP